MALQTAYKQFLAAPNTSLLASDASLHYITTLVSVHQSSDIVKHLNNQSHDLKLKEEKFLDAVEGANGLAVEVHTTIEFLTGGGAYLPKLDDNFLADRTVTFPITHFVTFDDGGKIRQIRKFWDQGSLLKLIDVIGKTGRNWPIQDGKDQIKLIINSAKAAGKSPIDVPDTEVKSALARSRENSTNATRDPHASLSLFAPRENTVQETLPAVVAPRASAKPPARPYHDLFVGSDAGNTGGTSAPDLPTHERSQSPLRSDIISPKGGAGKNYAPSRLFDTLEADDSSEHFYKPNPAKFQHFDLATLSEEREERPRPLAAKSSKHNSQWKFEDFTTPQKLVPSKVLRTNEVRHWGNSDDEEVASPVMVKKVDKPRKDAVTHFEFQDDGTPENERRLIGRPRGAGQQNGMSLYKDDLFGDDDVGAHPEPQISHGHANVKDRRKDFDSQFTMTDNSPGVKPALVKLSDDRAKAVKMMDANWAIYDQSPNQKENIPSSPSFNRPGAGKGPLSEATNVMSYRNDDQRGIATGGDGMGGKKGIGRQWGFGDESDGEEAGGVNQPSKFRTGKTQGKNVTSAGGDFWEF